MRFAAFVLVLGAAACSDRKRDRPAVTPPRDAQAQRTIPSPALGIVRPLPPHAIRSDGVGPYLLGDAINELLHTMVGGPVLLRFDIPGLVHTGVVRAEEEKLVVGGEPGGPTTFVAVFGADIARTESGVHVGSTREDLLRTVGPPADDPFLVRDPRLAASALRNVLAIADGPRLTAFLVTPDPVPSPAAAPPACTRPVVASGGDGGQGFGMCLTPAGELVEVVGTDLTIKSADGTRAIATLHAPDLAFAAPLRALEDGRDDLVVVTHVDDSYQRAWSVVAYRLEGSKLVRVAGAEPAFAITEQQTRWVGAPLREVDVYLQIASRVDGIEVGGVLTTDTAGVVRDVAPIIPIVLARGRGKPGSAALEGSGSASASAPVSAGSAIGSAPRSATP